ncbi:MAG TPA: hypothetical protein PLG34_13720 [Spirochaetota bacterium]|nr:hypothetical protein [Spirochaetota bacterium]
MDLKEKLKEILKTEKVITPGMITQRMTISREDVVDNLEELLKEEYVVKYGKHVYEYREAL